MMPYSLYTLKAPATFGANLETFLVQRGTDTSRRWNRTFRLWGDWLTTQPPTGHADIISRVAEAIRGAPDASVRMEVARIAFGAIPRKNPLQDDAIQAGRLCIVLGLLAEMSNRMEIRTQWSGIYVVENSSEFHRVVLASSLAGSTKLEFMLRRERWSEWLNPEIQPALESLLKGVTSKFRLEILPFYRNILRDDALEFNRDIVGHYTPDIARMADALGFSLQDFGYPPSHATLRSVLREPGDSMANYWSLPDTLEMP